VRGVVLWAGGGNFSRCGRLTNELTAAALRAGGVVADLQWQACLLDATLTPSERRDDAAISFVLEALGESLDVDDWTGLRGQMEANVAWAEGDHLEELARMSVPSLLIAHEQDPSFSVDGRREAVDRIPDGSLVVMQGVSHMTLDPAASERSWTEILRFLEAH
jgi:pimeloyl-ACP methyl ester carboxylesterase